MVNGMVMVMVNGNGKWQMVNGKCKWCHLQVQQTPNPLAQEPDEVPPLFVHSELFK
jgi:hypothetical protein